MIKCWHTLTYMCLTHLNDHSFLLSTVTENGYLFNWCISKDHFKSEHKSELQYSQKIATGSIEALNIRQSNGIIKGVCCSSDCSFSTIEFKQEQAIAKI